MKVIPVNLITAVAASSEDANKPASNLLDDHPRTCWFGTGTSETLTFTISGGISSALAIFNTNATGVSFVLSDPNAMVWEGGIDFETGSTWSSTNPSVTAITNLDGTSGACMVQWPETNATLIMEVTLVNNAGGTLYAGVAKAGKLHTYEGPELGLTESRKPLGFVRTNPNGSVYIKKKGTVRVFSMYAEIETAIKFHEFMLSVFDVIDLGPAAWMVTNLDNSRWLVFARFTQFPIGKHNTNSRTKLSFEITEVI